MLKRKFLLYPNSISRLTSMVYCYWPLSWLMKIGLTWIEAFIGTIWGERISFSCGVRCRHRTLFVKSSSPFAVRPAPFFLLPGERFAGLNISQRWCTKFCSSQVPSPVAETCSCIAPGSLCEFKFGKINCKLINFFVYYYYYETRAFNNRQYSFLIEPHFSKWN